MSSVAKGSGDRVQGGGALRGGGEGWGPNQVHVGRARLWAAGASAATLILSSLGFLLFGPSRERGLDPAAASVPTPEAIAAAMPAAASPEDVAALAGEVATLRELVLTLAREDGDRLAVLTSGQAELNAWLAAMGSNGAAIPGPATPEGAAPGPEHPAATPPEPDPSSARPAPPVAPAASPPAPAMAAPPAPRSSPAAGSFATRINVNTASLAELDLLPGIGPALAQRIIDERTKRGPFRDLRDLQRVRGIGAKTAENMQEHVRFE